MQRIFFKVTYNKLYDNVEDTDADKVLDGYEEGETEALLILPDSYSDTGNPTPLIFSAHGSGGIVSENPPHIGGNGYTTDCVEHGYASFDIHGTRPDGRSYGNRRYVEAVHRAYLHIVNNYNIDRRIFVCGGSMGGVCALNFVNFYPEIIRAIGLFYPRTNLNTVHFDGMDWHGSFDVPYNPDRGFFLADVISSEYGFRTPCVWDEEKTVGLNPWFNRAIFIDGVRYGFLPCPIKIWHGNIDTKVDYHLSVEYVKSLKRTGCYAELRTMEGTGHKTTPEARRELTLWFDRFN